MKLAGKKVGVLIESDFYEDEIFYYKHRFPEEGIDLHFLSRLWGQPSLTFTGLPGATVSDSRDRVRPAVESSGLEWPLRRTGDHLCALRREPFEWQHERDACALDGPASPPSRRQPRRCSMSANSACPFGYRVTDV